MSLKRKIKINANFSMASMTDIIFLLLIFFMVTSTLVVPNAIKVTLPQSQKQTAAKPQSRVIVDKNLNFYVAYGRNRAKQVTFEELTPFLIEQREKEPEMFVALYIDEQVPYSEVVKLLDLANKHKFKMVLAARPQRN